MRTLFPEYLCHSNNKAVCSPDGRSYTYKEIFSKAGEYRSVMEKRGVVCILSDNSFETTGFILEMLIANQALLVLSEDVDPQLVISLAQRYRPGYIWASKDKAQQILEDPKRVSKIGEIDPFKAGCGEHSLLRCVSFKTYRIHEDLALLLSTSGSTGSPKMVRLGYGNLLNSMRLSANELKLDDKCRLAVVLPLSHVFALSFALSVWSCGGVVYPVTLSVMSRQFADFYDRESVNCFIGIPVIYQMMQKTGFWNNIRVKNLRFAMSGGARLSAKGQRELVDTLKDKFWVGYGQTETVALVIGTSFTAPDMKLGTIGKAIDNVQLTIGAEDELWISSESVCMGYAYGYEDLNKADENHQIIHTGDLAYIDDEGYVFLKGRKSRSLNILGNRINLDELEELLHERFSPKLSLLCGGGDDGIMMWYKKS